MSDVLNFPNAHTIAPIAPSDIVNDVIALYVDSFVSDNANTPANIAPIIVIVVKACVIPSGLRFFNIAIAPVIAIIDIDKPVNTAADCQALGPTNLLRAIAAKKIKDIFATVVNPFLTSESLILVSIPMAADIAIIAIPIPTNAPPIFPAVPSPPILLTASNAANIINTDVIYPVAFTISVLLYPDNTRTAYVSKITAPLIANIDFAKFLLITTVSLLAKFFAFRIYVFKKLNTIFTATIPTNKLDNCMLPNISTAFDNANIPADIAAVARSALILSGAASTTFFINCPIDPNNITIAITAGMTCSGCILANFINVLVILLNTIVIDNIITACFIAPSLTFILLKAITKVVIAPIIATNATVAADKLPISIDCNTFMASTILYTEAQII